MHIIQVILLFLGLSLDSSIMMMHKGATIRNLSLPKSIVYSLLCAVVSVGAVMIGGGVSFFFREALVDMFEILVGCLILLAVGIMILALSFRKDTFVEKLDDSFNYRECFKMALFTNIDTLLIGVGFGLLGIGWLRGMILSFLITFITVMIALWFGYTQGNRYNKGISICGAALLIIFSLRLFIITLVRL